MEENKVSRKYVCKDCNVTCTSLSNLYEHVMGNKHKSIIRRFSPAGVRPVDSLQQFLDTYAKDAPLLGLEYIVEIQVDNYKYQCELCGTEAVRQNVIIHITGTFHMQKYLRKHYPVTLRYLPPFGSEGEFLEVLNSIALEIQLKHGRKKIQEVKDMKICMEAPTPAKVAKYSSSKTYLPNKLKDILKSTRTDLRRVTTFQNNDGFFDFLRTFEIENDEDAVFIKHITKNCTEALMKFQEERMANAHGSFSNSHLASAYKEGTDQQRDSHSLQSLDKAVYSLSPCAASLCKDGSTQEPGAVGNSHATQIFFSSIKNMEASEVVDVFEKIAATNPTFKRIDIPYVMKCLQEAGKLK